MLQWLESWLHSIIAVVLFAVLVELILPNNKFLKYTRLVIGLILILTILSPVLKLFEKNYLDHIDASYNLWEQQLNSNEVQTLSLSDIQAKAKDLQLKNESQSLRVTARSIATQMKRELNSGQLLKISQVQVAMNVQQANNAVEPYIEKVIVYVSPTQSSTEPEDELTIQVDEVKPITIESVTHTDSNQTSSSLQNAVNEEDAALIEAIITRNWDLLPSQVIIEVKDPEKR